MEEDVEILRTAICGLRAAGCELRVAGCALEAAGSELLVTRWQVLQAEIKIVRRAKIICLSLGNCFFVGLFSINGKGLIQVSVWIRQEFEV